MHPVNIRSNIADFFIGEKLTKSAACHGITNGKHEKETKSGVAVILSALVTAAVLTVFCQEEIRALAGFMKDKTPQRVVRICQKGRQEHILGTPDRPVVHRRNSVSHPTRSAYF